MSGKVVIAFVAGAILLVIQPPLSAERVYQYEVTVGPGQGYNFATINAAIVNIENNRSAGDLACIWIYPKTAGYEEQLHDTYTFKAPDPPCGDGQVHTFNVDCHNLPVDCDLRKPSSESGEVRILHYAPPTVGQCEGEGCENCPYENGITPDWHIYKYGVICNGNNLLERLIIENAFGSGYYAQASVNMSADGEVRDCTVKNRHGPAVQAGGDLFMSGCTISSYFGACVVFGNSATTDSTFATISDCTITPRWYPPFETPTAIKACGPGRIERVNVRACSGCPDGYGQIQEWGVFGIVTQLQNSEHVEIADCDIDLDLTTQYVARKTAALRVCGILSGRFWNVEQGGGDFPGKAVVRDCTIDVTGIEEDGPGENDGADIMVDGVCVRGGGTVEVYGCSSITTSWTPAGSTGEGYEYLLNEENGTLGASFAVSAWE